jgi:hypothetical protein
MDIRTLKMVARNIAAAKEEGADISDWGDRSEMARLRIVNGICTSVIFSNPEFTADDFRKLADI